MTDRHRKLLVLLAGASLIAGCATTDTGAPPAEAANAEETAETRAVIARSDPLTQAAYWQGEYEKNPADEAVIENFAETLRVIGSFEESLDVLQKGLAVHGEDPEMLLTAARTLSALKRYKQAEQTYVRLLRLDSENASAHAGLGLIFDQTGRHRAAQEAYRAALAIEPERPSTVSNLAMSLVLSGDARGAETLLRTAVDMPGASPMVRQNLALVVGLQGRFDEMREIGGRDLPDELVDANVEVIQRMLAPARDWGAMEGEG
jgi:Flp pilus assembly protein TadD